MKYWITVSVLLIVALAAALSGVNEYVFYAGYIVLTFVVLATAWNILGGYAGYVNFGTSAFFGVGAYAAVVLFKWLSAPLIVQIAAAAAMGALLGFGVGLLTLRLRGIFFAIATSAGSGENTRLAMVICVGCSDQAPAQPIRKALRNCASQPSKSEKSPNGP